MLLIFLFLSVYTYPTTSSKYPSFAPHVALNLRGGAAKDPKSIQKWKLEQQQLYTLRSTFLSEALSSRQIPLYSMLEVSTIEGSKPPQKIDWDCTICTPQNPKPCLYSFDAPIGSKVIAPLGTTDQWITLSALNRLRRMDPSKVEPMWHNQYAILKSWFGDEEFSLLQHLGAIGFFVSNILLDRPLVLKLCLASVLLTLFWVSLPLWEYVVGRILVSGLFWKWYKSWSRIVHAALPLKLLLGQMAWKFVAGKFDLLESKVRGWIIDFECGVLEEKVPVTVGEEEEEEEEEIQVGLGQSEEYEEYEEG